MSLSPLVPMATVLTAAAVLGGLAVVAYILKMRRRRFEVPFSTLWQRVLKEKETTSLWRHLRRILSLLLQLLIVGLLLFAVLDPRLGGEDPDAKNVVVIIDTSASMKTVDEKHDGKTVSRMVAARNKAAELLRSMGGGDSVMVMRMDGQTTPLTRFEHDGPRLARVVQGLEASDTPADLRRALGAAADALRDRKNPMIVLVGDGAYDEDALTNVRRKGAPAAAPGEVDTGEVDLAMVDLSGVDVRYVPVGTRGENVGIIAFNVRRYITNKLSYEVFIEVQNFGTEPARRKLKLYSGDVAIDVKEISLAPGERRREMYSNLGGGDDHRLRAVIELPASTSADGEESARHDIFPLDDEAFALLPKRTDQKVLLVTADNLYLEGAMLVYDNVVVDKIKPEEYPDALAAGVVDGYNAVVFDDFTPEALPGGKTHLLYFNPTGEHSPFTIRGALEAPRVTQVYDRHPTMRWIVLSDVNFDRSSVFAADRARGEVPLVTSVRSTLAAAKRDGRRKIVAFGFSLGGTDLTMRVAFPLTLANILDWFAGDDSDLITTYRTGQRFWITMDGTHDIREVTITMPSGAKARAPLIDGKVPFYGRNAGIHTIEAHDDEGLLTSIELAANLSNPAESNVVPAEALYLGGKDTEPLAQPDRFEYTTRRNLWLYLALLVLLLLGVEWITYNRRVTV